MDAGGMKMKAANDHFEKPPGMTVERLDSNTFAKYRHDIISLEHNAFDAREGTGYTERQKEVEDLYRDYLELGKHGELFVALEGEKVVAFIALRKESGDQATIEQFRLASDHGQSHLIQSFLHDVRTSLESEGYHHASIDAESIHHDIEFFKDVSWFRDFFVIEEGEKRGEERLAA